MPRGARPVLTASWPQLFGLLITLFIVVTLFFTVTYMLDGGVQNARPVNFTEAFFFKHPDDCN